MEIMHTHSLFTLLGERLMLHTNTVTLTTYNTLYEVSAASCCKLLNVIPVHVVRACVHVCVCVCTCDLTSSHRPSHCGRS